MKTFAKVDKKKLLEAIKSGKTEMFVNAFKEHEFGYSPNDIKVTFDMYEKFDGLGFRAFEKNNYFELTTFVRESEIDAVKKGFRMVNEELKRLDCLVEDE